MTLREDDEVLFNERSRWLMVIGRHKRQNSSRTWRRNGVGKYHTVIELEGNGTEYHLLCTPGANYGPMLYKESDWDDDKTNRLGCSPKYSQRGERIDALDVKRDLRSTPDHKAHLGDSGLWIPPAFREFYRQTVIRTPRQTIQHFGEASDSLGPYLDGVDERDFGDPSEFTNPRNPELAPNQISIKPEGEDAVTLDVEPNPGIRCDGGVEQETEQHHEYFTQFISAAVRSDNHEVTIEPADGSGWLLVVDGVDVTPEHGDKGFVWERLDVPSGWEDVIPEDGVEKAKEVYEGE